MPLDVRKTGEWKWPPCPGPPIQTPAHDASLILQRPLHRCGAATPRSAALYACIFSAPRYLSRFMSHVDALLCLDQADVKPAAKSTVSTARARKSAKPAVSATAKVALAAERLLNSVTSEIPSVSLYSWSPTL